MEIVLDRYKFDVANRSYKAAISKAKIEANIQFISNSPNKCKAAWSLIKENNNQNREIDSISVCHFNDYFTTIAEGIKQDLSFSKFRAMDYLNNNRTIIISLNRGY